MSERHFSPIPDIHIGKFSEIYAFPHFRPDFRALRELLFTTESPDAENLSPPRFGIRVAQGAARFAMRRGAHASPARRLYGPPDDRAMGGLGVRRAVTAFTIIEESVAHPPDIPAPRAALRSEPCIGNEAAAPLPNV